MRGAFGKASLLELSSELSLLELSSELLSELLLLELLSELSLCCCCYFSAGSGAQTSAPALPPVAFMSLPGRSGLILHITSPSGEELSSFQPVPAHSCYSPVRRGSAYVVPCIPSP